MHKRTFIDKICKGQCAKGHERLVCTGTFPQLPPRPSVNPSEYGTDIVAILVVRLNLVSVLTIITVTGQEKYRRTFIALFQTLCLVRVAILERRSAL